MCVCAHVLLTVCIWGRVYTQLYQDKETKRLSESAAAINMPGPGKRWQENISEAPLCKIFKLKTFLTNDTVQSYPNLSIFAAWTQQGREERTLKVKMKDRSSSEVNSTPCVNGDMPRPYHYPVNWLQCLNDNPKQRQQQCAPFLFNCESECESGVVCHHTKDNLTT